MPIQETMERTIIKWIIIAVNAALKIEIKLTRKREPVVVTTGVLPLGAQVVPE